jgi:hypothetical protein
MLELHNVPVSGGDWFWLVGFLVGGAAYYLSFGEKPQRAHVRCMFPVYLH